MFIAGFALALATSPLLAQSKLPQQPKPVSTPEQRSAAELALSSEPVFDDGTFLRIKETLLSYSDIQVRGGWPVLPAEAKLAPGASGADVALCAAIWSSAAIWPPTRKPVMLTTTT